MWRWLGVQIRPLLSRFDTETELRPLGGRVWLCKAGGGVARPCGGSGAAVRRRRWWGELVRHWWEEERPLAGRPAAGEARAWRYGW